jgi:hypothetical protein
MVEIALCLGVIAIALVAIIGVMPTGLKVQRDNREDTIFNQDGRFFLEAIRSGARGSDHLTNHVLSIVWSNSLGRTWIHTNTFGGTLRPGHINSLTNGRMIVGYLSTNKYVIADNRSVTNYVTALVRSLSGLAIERSDTWQSEERPEPLPFAFNYLLSVEVVPLITRPPAQTNFTASGVTPDEFTYLSNNWLRARNQSVNFSELRLTLQGPVFQRGSGFDVGNRVKTFRTLVGGVPDDVRRAFSGEEQDEFLPLFQPNVYVQIPP